MADKQAERRLDKPAEVQVCSEIEAISQEDWDACAGTDNPFQRYAFLHALEASGSATAKHGWQPQHLAVLDAGKVIGVAPVYLKMHSYGEYVFDFSWAKAYAGSRRSYYPKLQCCVPFTPVTGSRLLVRAGADEARVRTVLLAAMLELTDRHELSSAHITFLDESEAAFGEPLGLLRRRGIQYHWENRGYGCFDDFLGDLTSRKRKAVKRERRTAAEAPVEIRTLRGDAITSELWDRFFEFYLGTIDRKWSSAYLTRDFFQLIGQTMPDNIALIMAFEGDEPVAGALNLVGEDTLYGRYWGCSQRYKDLHFECCYYKAIEFAIDNGLKRIEAGAQGEHKIQRGYLPSYTHSLHWIADGGFRNAIADFLEREREGLAAEMEYLRQRSPFRAIAAP